MIRLFIHQPVFRLLSPLFIGVMVYLLILLLNNDTSQVQLLFESQEVYVCVIVSYLTLEVNRLSIVLFGRFKNYFTELQHVIMLAVVNSLLAILVSTFVMLSYFDIWVGFSPGQSELMIFNGIFVGVSLLYFTLYISHFLLNKENTLRLAKEELDKESITNEFKDFKNDINPNLLYSSLEQIITLAYENPDQAEELIDYLSSVYRYMLGHKKTELIELDEEIIAVNHLIKLLNSLPDFSMSIEMEIEKSSLQVIPGTLTTIVEGITKRTIINRNRPLVIKFYIEEEYLVIQHLLNDKLSYVDVGKSIEKTQRAYSYFTDIPVIEVTAYDDCYTKIPILTIEQDMAI